MSRHKPAPELQVTEWLNTPEPLSLARLRGRVVVLEIFQMLCPGCVSHGLPQAARIREAFSENDVAVVGLHSVFEHHEAQSPVSLVAFLHEYRVRFPVGVDALADTLGIPRTMAVYGVQGTPTLVLVDRWGRRRAQYFGQVPDLRLGAEIMALLHETKEASTTAVDERTLGAAMCAPEGCVADSVEQRS